MIQVYRSCSMQFLLSGAVKSMEAHPFKMLHDKRFRLTLNTDDRLMSGITLTDEYYVAHTVFGLSIPELHKLTINAVKSSFMQFDEKAAFIKNVLGPKYEAAVSAHDAAMAAEATASAISPLDDVVKH